MIYEEAIMEIIDFDGDVYADAVTISGSGDGDSKDVSGYFG